MDDRIRERATIVDVLIARAAEGRAGGLTFLPDGERLGESLSWVDLASRAGRVSSILRDVSPAGARALLFFRPGLDFLVAFLGCLHAGVVAVPCLPPSRPLRRSLERIQEVVRVARPSVVLSSGRAFLGPEEIDAHVSSLAACPVIDPRALPAVERIPESRASADGLAFLQFTSGSTSAPRGVMVGHANLMSNLRTIYRCVNHGPDSVSVTWLPVYHDLGLIDGLLEPIFGGFRCYAMPPHAFVQRPARWLRAISTHRATHGGGPNFAYELCLQKVSPAQAEGLDLSSWKYAYNGAEPIRVGTLQAFTRRFAPYGFAIGHFHLGYGLAEATLTVTGGSAAALRHRSFDAEALERGEVREVGPGTARARTIASCGPAFEGFDLAIVEPESRRELPEGRIGEVWISGPSVAMGYYGNAAATAETFAGRLQPTGRGAFLRTGDLGFVVGGELYVVGRLKDLVILAGRNIHPHDVERSVESADESLGAGCAAAFSVEGDRSERLIVLVERPPEPPAGGSERPLGDLAAKIGRAIARDHRIDASVVAIVAPGALMKTSSGKVRRGACKRAYETKGIEILERHECVG